MSVCFGLHIGNTGMCLAMVKDGNVNVISNHLGDRITPAVLSVIHEDEILVGIPAKQNRNRNSTVINNKQFLQPNISLDTLEDYNRSCICTATSGPDGSKTYSLTDENFSISLSVRDVLQKYMQYMYDMAKNSIQDEEKLSVVMSVPVWSDLEIRDMIREVAEDVGFKVLHLITEPSAAVLAYNLDKNEDAVEYYIVFRAGGLTNDVTVIENRKGLFSIVSNKHVNDNKISGNELTKAMVTYLAKEFYNKYKLDPLESRNAINKLTQNAEQCKKILSILPTAQIFIDSLIDGYDWEFKMTRARYEHLIQGTCQAYVKLLDECLEELKAFSITEKDITKIVICGGTMKVPLLQQMIRKRLNESVQVLSHLSGDEVVSLGCAEHGKTILGLKHFNSTTDVEDDLQTLVKDIKIVRNNETLVQFNEGDFLPSVKKFLIQSNGENEMSFTVQDDSTEIGVLKLPIENGVTDLNLMAHLKENGSITISVHS